MLIHSSDTWRQDSMYKNVRKYLKIFAQAFPAKMRCGISAVHHHLADLAGAAREALYASALPLADKDGRCFYMDMGVFQMFIATVDNPGTIEFSDETLRPIEAYDNENNSSLYATAKSFVLRDGDLKSAAQELSQHVNTIRYRLDSISSLLGENVLGKKGYERLSAAIKIRVCREAALLIGF
jgi:sugar diacid utilization regulator